MILCFCRVYPYILIVSAIFMLITIVIYTAYPKLLNHYSRLMRQYSFSMMLAFSFLAIIQLKAKDEMNIGVCVFFGRLSFFGCFNTGLLFYIIFTYNFVFHIILRTSIEFQCRNINCNKLISFRMRSFSYILLLFSI